MSGGFFWIFAVREDIMTCLGGGRYIIVLFRA